MSTKWRDALKEFAKRDLPKPVKKKRVNVSQEREKARQRADILIGFNNSRIESKKRQRSKGDRFAFNNVHRNGAMTADQIRWLTKMEILKYEREKEKQEKMELIETVLAKKA
jgi:hypothetical protein